MTPPATVLVIDDDPFNRFNLTACLEDAGYRCLEAGTGAEGLALLARERAEVVITDLRMPGMDGLGVLAALGACSPGTPVIMLTGTGEGVDAQRALEAGARACLFKPLTRLETLLEAIQAVLAPPP